MSLKRSPILKSRKIRVGITIGDPSGIGPVITLKALNKLGGLADFTVIGSACVLNNLSGAKLVDLHNLPLKGFSLGRVKAENGRASIAYLDRALELIRNKEIDCLVTCPISKEAITKAGFDYSGHTEYFLKKCKVKEAVMMLLNDKLKFSLLSRHIPLGEVPAALEKEKICANIRITYNSLKKIFGIPKPRLVVCGLNPHGSDNGLFGKEELEVIRPALEKMEAEIKANIDGPLSSDVAIFKAYKGEYDCVIAAYHDQALIPLKLTGYASGVNITLGLPFIRTSPLHGTAFDLAKNPGLANPDSLIAAIKLAIKCVSEQRKA